MKLFKFKITRIKILNFYCFTSARRVDIIALNVPYIFSGPSV